MNQDVPTWLADLQVPEVISVGAAFIALAGAAVSYISFRLNRRATSLKGWLEIVKLIGDDEMLAYRKVLYDDVLLRDATTRKGTGRRPLSELKSNAQIMKAIHKVSINLERASYIIRNHFVNKKYVMEIFADVFVNLGYAVAEWNAEKIRQMGADVNKDFQRRFSRKFIVECARWLEHKGYSTWCGDLVLKEFKL